MLKKYLKILLTTVQNDQENTPMTPQDYFDILKQQVRANYFGGSQDKYLESAEFSSDEIEQSITYTENYKYS